MRDPALAILTAYKSALDGQITAIDENGLSSPVKAYSHVPTGKKYPYIYLHGQTGTEDEEYACKDTRGYNTTILCEAVTGFQSGDFASSKPCLQLADAIMQIVGDGVDLSPDFTDVRPTLDNAITFEETNDNYKIFRRVLTLRNQVI